MIAGDAVQLAAKEKITQGRSRTTARQTARSPDVSLEGNAWITPSIRQTGREVGCCSDRSNARAEGASIVRGLTCPALLLYTSASAQHDCATRSQYIGEHHGSNSRCGLERRQVWQHVATRLVVGIAACGFSRIQRVFGLRNLGSVSERLLHVRPLSLAFLFTRALRQFPSRAVRP